MTHSQLDSLRAACELQRRARAGLSDAEIAQAVADYYAREFWHAYSIGCSIAMAVGRERQASVARAIRAHDNASWVASLQHVAYACEHFDGRRFA